jgi:hypothetical protein
MSVESQCSCPPSALCKKSSLLIEYLEEPKKGQSLFYLYRHQSIKGGPLIFQRQERGSRIDENVCYPFFDAENQSPEGEPETITAIFYKFQILRELLVTILAWDATILEL